MVTPFVGRREELRRVELALSAAMAGQGKMLAIHGDPGIGKSRLVEAAAAMAARRGLRVLRGRAVEHRRRLPMGLVTAAMEDVVTERAGELDRRSRQLLAAFFPTLGPVGRQARLALREPERVHGALRRLLAGRRDRAVALLLDDVHWADAESERFLDRLLRDPPPDRVLVVLAYRPRQVSPRLVAAVAQAVDGGWGAEVAPGGLTLDEAAELAGAEVGGTDLRAALAAGQGNPRYLTLLLRPAHGEYGLTAELESLTAPALLLLRGAAVVGDPFDARVAAAVARVAEPDRRPALDQLVAHDLVRETDPAGTYRFRHRLLRDAVYARSGPGWRAGAHARAVARLRCRDPVELAPHLVEVAEPGDQEVLAEAAAAVTDTAPAAARRWGTAALALLPDRDDTSLPRAELLVTVGTALSRTGHLVDGADRLREALHLLPADAPQRAVAAWRAADADRLRGDPAAARAVLHSESGRTSLDHALLRVGLAALECGDGNLGAAEHHLRAVPTGTVGHDEAVALAECAVRAWVRAVAGDLPAARPAGARYADALDALSDDRAVGHLEHLVYAVEALQHLGSWERGRRLARRGMLLAHRAGWRTAQAALSAELAESDRFAGRVCGAAAAAAECVDLARTIGSPVLLRRGLVVRAEALLWRDRAPGAALRVAEQAVSVDADGGRSEDARRAGLVLAEVALATGRSSGLAERVVLAGGGPGLPCWAVPARPRVYETLVRLALADGDRAGARGWATRAEDVTGTYHLPCWGPARLARAAVLLCDDNRTDNNRTDNNRTDNNRTDNNRTDNNRTDNNRTGAGREAEEAAAAFDRAGSPLEQGRGCLLVAEAFAADRPAAAAAALRTAKGIAVRCGSGRLHRLADAARASVGARRRTDRDGDPTDPLLALSRREREVAEQLRAGLTNREIAERLYITDRTVETHVKHILHKLDLPSRAAVAGLSHW